MKAKNIMPIAMLTLLASCTEEPILDPICEVAGTAIAIHGNIDQDNSSRADQNGFASGDRMGVYIVDYAGGSPGTLVVNGNHATNALYEFDGTNWSCTSTFYWKDNVTPIDVYGYYPYTSVIGDVGEYAFEVMADQSVPASDGTMAAYEASDFLWAKATGATQSDGKITLSYKHRMAGMKVVLTKGSGFSDTEWAKLQRRVAIDNVMRQSTIDFSTGTVTASGSFDKQIVMADEDNDTYRAVIPPQTLQAGANLLSITIDGNSYGYAKQSALTFVSGKLHTLTMAVNKKDSGDYELKLTSEEITPWENDKLSHSFLEYEYTVINVETEGTLKDLVTASGKDATQIKNLKLTGRITNSDFDFMRNEMSNLTMLNLQEVTCVKALVFSCWHENIGDMYITDDMIVESFESWYNGYMDNAIPCDAFCGKKTLRRLVLPNNLIHISGNAFSGCGFDVNTSIIIPNNVNYIGQSAFGFMSEAGELILNDKIEYICSYAFASGFESVEWPVLPNLKFLGSQIFNGVKSIKGHYYVPDDIQNIAGHNYDGGSGTWEDITFQEVGELIIPKNIERIYGGMFPGFSRGCYLTIHDNVKQIGSIENNTKGGLSYQRFINKVILPESLTIIGKSAFYGSKFTAGLTLPSSLRYISDSAFGNTTINGSIEIPEGVCVLPSGCFSNSAIDEIILPSSIEMIGDGCFSSNIIKSITINKNCYFIDKYAFANCSQLSRVVCLNPIPPTADDNIFEGCSFDHLILEVPEQSLELYRNADGWKNVKFITAYHELAVSASSIHCLEKGVSYPALLRAEGNWRVSSCPSWCKVSPSSGSDKRTEITINVDPTSHGDERSGEIIFSLDGTEYTTYISVNQASYEIAEDTEFTLQTASAGATEIPILIIGEGFDVTSIQNGSYIDVVNKVYESITSIEPFKTYKDYFTVTASIAVSPDAGIEQEFVRYNRFHSNIDDWGFHPNFDNMAAYAQSVSSHISATNLKNALIICVLNSDYFQGWTQMSDTGANIAVVGLTTDSYPYDFRGLVQHYALGRVFGRLAHEDISHFTFLQTCNCPGCNDFSTLSYGLAQGWYKNVSLKGSMNLVPWSHYIFDPKYSDIVDVYEGAWSHMRGIYRSENQSVMNTYVPYFNTISRELIVRRIMSLAGKTFSLDDFLSKDSRENCPN